ncbi:MAG: acyl carrier protein [Dehalococcoidia bacterium]|nr:acyl carrier protein [Dehalococcoidia bacterium]MDD5494902.1 acyl carrier protein [Dehalococcoidia bacterium]
MNVFDEVKEAICRIQPGIDESRITPEALFKDDLEIDSLSKVEMALALEEKLDLNLQDVELNDIKSVGQVVALIESRLKVRNA